VTVAVRGEARKKKQEVLAREYKAEVKLYSKKERDALAQAKSDADDAFKLQMVGAVLDTLGGIVKVFTPDQQGSGGSAGANAQVAAAEKEKEAEETNRKQLENQVEQLDKDIEVAEKNQESKKKIEDLETEKKAKKEAIETANQVIKQIEEKIDKMAEAASNSAAESLRNARRLGELRNEKREIEIENAAALAETVEVLKNMKIELGDVKTAIAVIKVVVNCLGKIATALEATATFWIEQVEMFKILRDIGESLKKQMKMYADKGQYAMKKLVIRQLERSGYNWLALWHMNYLAMAEIQMPYHKATSVVNHLGLEDRDQLQNKIIAIGAILEIEAQAAGKIEKA